MHPDTASRIAAIARDREHGAAELALRAAEALSLAQADELSEAVGAVIRAQPGMASVYNAAQAALAGTLPEFVARLRQSTEIVSRKTKPIIAGKTVLTHSHSSTVVRALREGHPARVVCTESLPGGEGHDTAASTNGEVIPDAAVYSALAKVEVFITGADAVTPDAIVNKIGTALIALAARERGVPAYVLCGSEKYVPAGWKPELGEIFEAAPRSWFSGVIDDT